MKDGSLQHSSGSVRRIYGVDFSGAKNAGKKIWIACGVIEGDKLHIENCQRASELLGSGRDRDRCLAALRELIASEKESLFGLDFPFGLPRALFKEARWEEFILSFPERYLDPEDFRRACRSADGGSELKRVTDRESRTPFSCYNLRLFRQTYYGIRDVLEPLVRHKSACVLPMQSPAPGKPWIIEICPASTLKKIGLQVSYKGKKEEHRMGRQRILRKIGKAAKLPIPSKSLRSVIINDTEGDALDSVIAAFATLRALDNQEPDGLKEAYMLEGYVYT